MASIIQQAVRFAEGHLDQILIDGPELTIGSRTALSLALVVHELTTNAVKYGALSTDQGHVEVRWDISTDADPQLQFRWIETGGPPVQPPTRSGFGSRLIQGGLSGTTSTVEIEYAPAGVKCFISAPLGRLQAGN